MLAVEFKVRGQHALLNRSSANEDAGGGPDDDPGHAGVTQLEGGEGSLGVPAVTRALISGRRWMDGRKKTKQNNFLCLSDLD